MQGMMNLMRFVIEKHHDYESSEVNDMSSVVGKDVKNLPVESMNEINLFINKHHQVYYL